MYNTQSGQEDPAANTTYQGRGTKVGGTYYRIGNSVWQVWIPEDHSHVKPRRMAGESQEGRKNLEERRLEGAKEAAEEKKAMA
jgi:hypothetical protein